MHRRSRDFCSFAGDATVNSEGAGVPARIAEKHDDPAVRREGRPFVMIAGGEQRSSLAGRMIPIENCPPPCYER